MILDKSSEDGTAMEMDVKVDSDGWEEEVLVLVLSALTANVLEDAASSPSVGRMSR